MYQTLSELKKTDSYPRVLVHSIVSKHQGFTFSKADKVFSSALIVFMHSDYSDFAVLQSSLYEQWIWQNGSSLGEIRRFTPSDCYETFPFPKCNQDMLGELEKVGCAYYQQRTLLMLSHNLTMTEVYNIFHTQQLGQETLPPEVIVGITTLRETKMSLDNLVLKAYGWNNTSGDGPAIALDHGFYPQPYLPEQKNVRFTMHGEARRLVIERLHKLTFNRP